MLMKNKNSTGNKKLSNNIITVSEKKAEKKMFWIVIIALLITFLCYLPSFNNTFTNWDDSLYITENPTINKPIFSESFKLHSYDTQTILNYHPITMVSLRLNYYFSKFNPTPYIAVNIFIHLVNVLFLFILVNNLTKGKYWVAFLTSLWFGIHPMHVESVAWISGRKDVLYVFFYLISLVFYTKYTTNHKKWSYFLCILFFILSCLSKAMAVSLPLVLLLIDFYKNRIQNYKQVIIEKIPFFIISLLVGFNAFQLQSNAITAFETFSIFHRFLFASYGFVLYLFKVFFPVNLCAFYPYPNLNDLGNLPIIFYLSPFIAAIILALPFFIALKLGKQYAKIIIFGLFFYFFNIFLVLQFVSVGAAIASERYTYLSYTGIFFIFAYIFHFFKFHALPGLRKIGTILGITCLIYSLLLAYNCYERTKVWKNSETLWTDVIQKYPNKVETAYKNRGNYYAQLNQLDKAFADYEILVQMNSKDPKIYSNLGNIYGLKKEFDKALESYNKALTLNPKSYEAVLNRAITKTMMNNVEGAFNDFNAAEKINPNDEKLYANRGLLFYNTANYANALLDFNTVIEKYLPNAQYYYYRGLCNYVLKNTDKALTDLQKSLELQSNNGNVFNSLAIIYNETQNYEQAWINIQKAKQLGIKIDENMYNNLKLKF